jgi:hypothetical protein
MSNRIRAMGVAVLAAGVLLPGCGGGGHVKTEKVHPAHVEHVEGSEISKITLTEKAMERLAIATAPVQEAIVKRAASPRRVVPYAAVLYDAHGDTWVYTSPETRTFLRHPIGVEYIEGDLAVLTDGPPTGTPVVTVGAAELFGAEFEIGH